MDLWKGDEEERRMTTSRIKARMISREEMGEGWEEKIMWKEREWGSEGRTVYTI